MPNLSHIDTIYNSLSDSKNAALSPVAASWRRSALNYGLKPEAHKAQSLISDHDLAWQREANRLLLQVSAPIMDMVFNAVGHSGCLVALATSDGLILERRANSGDSKFFDEAQLCTGANWNEANEGTNGIGTCLAEERAITIYRDQHFKAGNVAMSCMDAPIRNHLGRLIGVIDVSICQEDHNVANTNLISFVVKNAARDIESQYFCQKFARSRIVEAGNGKTSAPALIAVDDDDLILGATFAARKLLGLTDEIVNANMPAVDFLNLNFENTEIADAERAILRRALARSAGNIAKAARSLGIGRATFYRRMQKAGLFKQ